MNHRTAYLVMVGLLVLCGVGIVGGAYGVQSLLSGQSQHLVTLKAKVAGLDAQQASLVTAQKDIKTYNSLYQIAKVVVPENKDQAETVRQIVNLAAASSVKLGSVTFPSSTLGNTAASATSGASSATAAAPPVNVNSPTTKLSQLTPVPNIPGVYVLQVTIAGDSNHPVGYNQLISFLDRLEQNRLTAQVNSVIIAPATGSTSLFNFTLTLSSYIKP